MSFGHALYYPHIHLTNKNWLKHALLFWENLSRIVPKSIEPSDSEDIIRIKYETGFIKDYYPKSYETAHSFEEFSRDMKPIIESESFFNDRYFRQNSIKRNYRSDFENRSGFFSQMLTNSGSYIHIEKIHPSLIEYFIDRGLALRGEHEWEGWIKIDNEIGLLYMSYFAKSISKNTSLPIVTDKEQAYSTSIYFESRINSDYKSQFEYRLGNLLIESVVPKNINDVPLDKIIEIRDKYSDERISFFNEVSNLTNTISSIDNQTALNDALHLHSKLILKEVKNLEDLFKSHKIETINKLLGISIPTSIASLTDYIPGQAKPFALIGGIGFGIFSTINSVKKERLELQKNPKSYLLNIQNELSSHDFLTKIERTFYGLRKW